MVGLKKIRVENPHLLELSHKHMFILLALSFILC